MLEFLRKHKKKLIFPSLLLIYWILLLFNKSSIYFNAVSIFSPAEKVTSNILRSIKEYWNGYMFLVNTESDNSALREELRKMKGIKVSFDELKKENKKLKELLSFKEEKKVKCTGASIIFRGAVSRSNTIFLDKGKEDGIKKNMVVVVPEGIVGKVVKTTKSISLVHLITHHNSAVDAIIQRTRDRCVFQGGEPCRLKYLDDKSGARVGDVITSSGLGGIFPAGFPLGKIVSIKKDDIGIFLNAKTIPLTDLTKLEEVLILENPYQLEVNVLKKGEMN